MDIISAHTHKSSRMKWVDPSYASCLEAKNPFRSSDPAYTPAISPSQSSIPPPRPLLPPEDQAHHPLRNRTLPLPTLLRQKFNALRNFGTLCPSPFSSQSPDCRIPLVLSLGSGRRLVARIVLLVWIERFRSTGVDRATHLTPIIAIGPF